MSLLTTAPHTTSHRRTWVALGALALVQFVLVLDSAIINVALVTIGHEFDTPPHRLTWVINAYALTFGGLLLLGGRLADVVGRRRLFNLGVAVFGLASLTGAAATSTAWLILARAVQGAGAAMTAPAALALVATLFPQDEKRGKALGLLRGHGRCRRLGGPASWGPPYRDPRVALRALDQRARCPRGPRGR